MSISFCLFFFPFFVSHVLSRGQPRIVCYDPQRETRGWDGPGAYEWDDRPDDPDIPDVANITDGPTDCVSPDSAAPAATDSGEDKGTAQAGDKEATEDGGANVTGNTGGFKAPSGWKGGRPRGISVRDPERASPVFREGSSGFIPHGQTNVRRFPEVPVSGLHGALVREDDKGRDGEAEDGGEGVVGGSRSSMAMNRGRAGGTGTGDRKKKTKKVRRGRAYLAARSFDAGKR